MIVLLNGNSSVGKTTLLQNIPDKYGKYDGDEICPSILKEVIKKSIENNWF